ncbi:aminotransferase class V-fold PLP-dependent enzyme [Kineococcus sp. SYSU DK003]|uniref:aminotransferase class V-fold PLP-dependent enzyme n=1 Tax=Kineococcus sp. SYSU DK003 TaxID=3383124 RepID=UPI003D7D97CF
MGTSVERGPLLDVSAERARTPGSQAAHHFNAAGSALPTTRVVGSVVEHLLREQTHGGYEAAAMVADDLESVYSSAARLVGATPGEIALFDSATTGLRAVVDALRLSRGDRLLVSRSTYVSHALHLMSLAQERGVELLVARSAPDGAIDLGHLDDLLTGGRGGARTVVCVAHIPTSSGLVEPAAAVGELAARHGATYVLDATQSVGHLRVDVATLRCDALVTTGRKFLRAPRGTGFAYVSAALTARLAPAVPDVRGARWTGELAWELSPTARRFESWETSIAGRLGLGAALAESLQRGVDRSEEHLVATAEALRADLRALPRVNVQDPPAARSGIVTFTVDGVPAREVVAQLAARRVRTVAVPATHAQWDLGHRGLDAVVRASLHVYNDAADRGALLEAVAALPAVETAA